MDEEDSDLAWKIILWLILFLVFGIIIIACKKGSDGYIMTVNGPVSADKTGLALEHEHILVDFIGADSTGYFRWEREKVIEKALPFILDAKRRGVQTFIECTPSYLGRDPLLLKELSHRTGINFITNTGYYGARNNLFLPTSFFSSDATEIADLWITEFESGIEETGIKPGFIKIAVDPADTLSAEHKKVITAAGLTHLATGLTIVSHTGPDGPALEQINILKKLGVDPSAFIWVHAQRGSLKCITNAAKEGTWISFDNVRSRPELESGAQNSIEWYATKILELKNEGLLNKVLVSHDSGWYDPAKPDGGTFNGFTDIFDKLIPALKERGFIDSEINQILEKNPREAFRIRIRKLHL
jgi:phosphotriesterase-related protein